MAPSEQPQVRFTTHDDHIPASGNPVIGNDNTLDTVSSGDRPEEMTEEQWKEIRQLTMSMQQSRLNDRMNQFVFEPVSRPASRVRQSQDPSTRIYLHKIDGV
jgi:hypothetical protein